MAQSLETERTSNTSPSNFNWGTQRKLEALDSFRCGRIKGGLMKMYNTGCSSELNELIEWIGNIKILPIKIDNTSLSSFQKGMELVITELKSIEKELNLKPI